MSRGAEEGCAVAPRHIDGTHRVDTLRGHTSRALRSVRGEFAVIWRSWLLARGGGVKARTEEESLWAWFVAGVVGRVRSRSVAFGSVRSCSVVLGRVRSCSVVVFFGRRADAGGRGGDAGRGGDLRDA